MSFFTETLILQLERFSSYVPLPWFVFLGAFTEEIIAPIPSPLVMTLGGSLSASKGLGLSFLVFLALVGSIGKTIASYIVYVFADKLEDLFLKRFNLGKLVGFSHKDIESIGKHLNQGARDDIVLLLFRAIPIIPTAPVSLVSGLIKINIKTYLWTTFVGYFIRNLVYLYLGFTGVGALESVNSGLDSLESIGYLVIAFLMAGVIGYAYLHRSKKGHEGILQKITKGNTKD